jgi:hypothetical protein
MLLMPPEQAETASIALFSTLDCSSRDLSVPRGETRVFYVNMSTDGLPASVSGIAAIRLRISGLPDGWIAVATLNQAASHVYDEPFGPRGTDVVFDSIVDLGSCVNLYTVAVTASTFMRDVILKTLNYLPESPPGCETPAATLPCPFPCPIPNLPTCVEGGELYINATNPVVPSTWSRVKGIYK